MKLPEGEGKGVPLHGPSLGFSSPVGLNVPDIQSKLANVKPCNRRSALS